MPNRRNEFSVDDPLVLLADGVGDCSVPVLLFRGEDYDMMWPDWLAQGCTFARWLQSNCDLTFVRGVAEELERNTQ